MHQQRDAYSRPAIRDMLRQSRLRPTSQRVALAELLFSWGSRHVSAEQLHAEAKSKDVIVSLATVYNTLHQFTEAGLLREVAVDGSKAFFDTNISDHHHFLIEGNNELVDIPIGQAGVGRIPQPPPGFEITRIDVMVRLRRIRS